MLPFGPIDKTWVRFESITRQISYNTVLHRAEPSKKNHQHSILMLVFRKTYEVSSRSKSTTVFGIAQENRLMRRYRRITDRGVSAGEYERGTAHGCPSR